MTARPGHRGGHGRDRRWAGRLAVGYYLRRRRCGFVILDAEVGGGWRQRWDSLQLFTPAGFTHLPEMDFPGARAEFPTKAATADYLTDYARRFALPVQLRSGSRRCGSTGRTCRGARPVRHRAARPVLDHLVSHLSRRGQARPSEGGSHTSAPAQPARTRR